MIKHQKQHLFLLGLGLFSLVQIAVISDTFVWPFSWYDQQRIAQLGFFVIAALLTLFFVKPCFSHTTTSLIAAFFGLGFLSACFSAYPVYALKELMIYLGALLMLVLAAQYTRNNHWQHALLLALAFAGLSNAVQFLMAYIAAFASGFYQLDAKMLINGFSNIRMLNQFQALLFPVLAYLLHTTYHSDWKFKTYALIALGSTFLLQWCIAFTLGGRSLWLGLLVSHSIILFLLPRFRYLVGLQLGAALLGFLLFIILFVFIPDYFDLSSNFHSSLRSSSSGRLENWWFTLALFQQSPYLGVGPMHFAAEWVMPVPVAGPHQTILQLLAEWGIFATVIMLFLIVRGLIYVYRFMQNCRAQAMDASLFIVIITACVMAQFEGMFNGAYTQVWFAALLGVALARWLPELTLGAKGAIYQKSLLKIAGVFVLSMALYVLVLDVPNLMSNSQLFLQQHGFDYFTPRFWLQGRIPMDVIPD